MVDDPDSGKLDVMYKMTKPLLHPVANPCSTIVSTKHADYVVINGGYQTSSSSKSKEVGKQPVCKLDRVYMSIHNFTTLYFDCERDQLYNQEFINEESGKSWNVKNSLVTSNGEYIYILGGCPMLEDADLHYEKFLCLKYKITFGYMEVSNVEAKFDMKIKRTKKTVLFNNCSSIDHCYKAYKDKEDSRYIYSVCASASDTMIDLVMRFDTETEKVKFYNLRKDYRPVPSEYVYYKYTYPKDNATLAPGISEEYFCEYTPDFY